MDNLHHKIIFDLDTSGLKKRNSRKEPIKSSKIPKFRRKILWNTENISLQIFYIFVLSVEIVTIFEPNAVTIFALHTMRKIANFVRPYFPHITTFFNQI